MLIFTFRGGYAEQEHHKIISVALDTDALKKANLLKSHFMNCLEYTLAALLANWD